MMPLETLLRMSTFVVLCVCQQIDVCHSCQVDSEMMDYEFMDKNNRNKSCENVTKLYKCP